MKKIFMFAAVLLASVVALSSCGSGESVSPKASIVGCWQLQWSDANLDYVDVYAEFNEDMTFNLYQKLQSPSYKHYKGSYLIADGVLSGEYSDGKSWGSSYNIAIEDGVMTLTSTTNSDDVSVFLRCEPRSDVKVAVVSSVRGEEQGDEQRFF